MSPFLRYQLELLEILTAILSYEFLPGCWLKDTASNQYQEWCLWWVVIYINIDVVINQHCRAQFLFVECLPNFAPACWHLLNKPWLQLFSCFSLPTSCAHTAIKWIGREPLHLLYTLAKVLRHLPLRITVLARDSIAYFVIICGLCMLLPGNHCHLQQAQYALCLV